MEAKRLADGTTGYFWHLPTWAKRQKCPLASEPLGQEYGQAIDRANFLNQYLDSWRIGDQSTQNNLR